MVLGLHALPEWAETTTEYDEQSFQNLYYIAEVKQKMTFYTAWWKHTWRRHFGCVIKASWWISNWSLPSLKKNGAVCPSISFELLKGKFWPFDLLPQILTLKAWKFLWWMLPYSLLWRGDNFGESNGICTILHLYLHHPPSSCKDCKFVKEARWYKRRHLEHFG